MPECGEGLVSGNESFKEVKGSKNVSEKQKKRWMRWLLGGIILLLSLLYLVARTETLP